MNNLMRDEMRVLSKGTPITIALAFSIISVTATGAWFTGRLAYRVEGVEARQKTAEVYTEAWRRSATENNQEILRLIDKMDRRIEWIEKTQE